MQPDQSQPTTFMDRFCSAWRWLCAGIFVGFGLCVMLLDSGYRFQSMKLGFFYFGGIMTFIGMLPSLLLEIARRIRQIRQFASNRS